MDSDSAKALFKEVRHITCSNYELSTFAKVTPQSLPQFTSSIQLALRFYLICIHSTLIKAERNEGLGGLKIQCGPKVMCQRFKLIAWPLIIWSAKFFRECVETVLVRGISKNYRDR